MMPERPTDYILYHCSVDDIAAIKKYFPMCEIDEHYTDDAIKLFNPTTNERGEHVDVIELELGVETEVSFIEHESEYYFKIVCAEGEKRSDVLIFSILWMSGCNVVDPDFADIMKITEGKTRVIYHSIVADAFNFSKEALLLTKKLLPEIKHSLCGIIGSSINILDVQELMKQVYDETILPVKPTAEYAWIVLDGTPTMQLNTFITFTWN